MINVKKSILALTVVAAVLAAAVMIPAASDSCTEGPTVAYFLDSMIEGS